MQPFFIIAWIVYAVLLYIVFKVGASRPHSKEITSLAKTNNPERIELHVRRAGIHVLTSVLFIVCLAYTAFIKLTGGN